MIIIELKKECIWWEKRCKMTEENGKGREAVCWGGGSTRENREPLAGEPEGVQSQCECLSLFPSSSPLSLTPF